MLLSFKLIKCFSLKDMEILAPLLTVGVFAVVVVGKSHPDARSIE